MALTRLEKTLFRLRSQHAVLKFVLNRIRFAKGPVFEIGLGLGRTYDHLRHHLNDRRIFAFDRKSHAYDDCMPPADRLIEGELTQTLPQLVEKHSGSVVLSHVDIGSFDRRKNAEVARFLAAQLPECMAPGGFVVSDLPLETKLLQPLPLPDGAREGSIYLYQRRQQPGV
jgi:hypothetical protein